MTSGAWKGFAFTYGDGAGTTVSPPDFANHPEGTQLCASGSVGAADTSIVLLGLNLNQEKSSPVVGTITPSGSGIAFAITNKGGAPLLLQLQGPLGATDPNDRFCAKVNGSAGVVPFSSFNTKCWDGSGVAYARSPLRVAGVLVPGDSSRVVPFDFCIDRLGEVGN